MKNVLIIGMGLWTLASNAIEPEAYKGSTVAEVWSAIKAKPNEGTPKAVISKLTDFLGSRSIKQDARQTLDKKFDLFAAPRRKLAHPHGLCYLGIWKIDTASDFTGLFEKGTRAPIIVRASEAIGYVNRGNRRAFGFAGKIFPGVNPDDKKQMEEVVSYTADFFTVDDLGGTDLDQFLKSSFTNAPPVTIDERTSPNVITLGAIFGKTFGDADKQPGVRQVYPLSESGLKAASDAVTPETLRIVGGEFGVKKTELDFRTEALLANHTKPVIMGIDVRKTVKDEYQRIGEVQLLEDTISVACDEALHFHHPVWKD
jgi:hypothetical protein